MKRMIVFISVVIIVLLGGPISAQEKKFHKACEINSVNSYDDFLRKYPSSEFVPAVEFKKAKLINSKNYWSDFIKRFPEGVYHDSAFVILCKSESDEARKTNTKESYKKYCKEYSTCINMAEMMQGYYNLVKVSNDIDIFDDFIALSGEKYATYAEEISYLKAKKINTIEEWNHFLGIYKNSKYESDAKKKIEELKQSAKWEEVKKINTIEVYREVYFNNGLQNYHTAALNEIRTQYGNKILSNEGKLESICAYKLKLNGLEIEKLNESDRKIISGVVTDEMKKSMGLIDKKNCKKYIEVSFNQIVESRKEPGRVLYQMGRNRKPATSPKIEELSTETSITYVVTDSLFKIRYTNKFVFNLNNAYFKIKEIIGNNGVGYGIVDSYPQIDILKTKMLLKGELEKINPFVITRNTDIELIP